MPCVSSRAYVPPGFYVAADSGTSYTEDFRRGLLKGQLLGKDAGSYDMTASRMSRYDVILWRLPTNVSVPGLF